MCRGPALSMSVPGASMSEPGALCIGVQRSLCRGPALSRRSVLGPGSLCIGPLCSLYRAPARSVSGPSLSVSGLRALCVGPRRSLHPAPALSVSGPGALRVGPERSPGALCVGPRRSLCPGPALDLCQAPALSRRSLCRAGERWAPARSICVGPRACPALSVSGRPRSLCRGPCRVKALSPRRSLTPIHVPIHVRGPLTQIRRSACHPSSPARSIFPGENPKPYCLGEKSDQTDSMGKRVLAELSPSHQKESRTYTATTPPPPQKNNQTCASARPATKYWSRNINLPVQLFKHGPNWTQLRFSNLQLTFEKLQTERPPNPTRASFPSATSAEMKNILNRS